MRKATRVVAVSFGMLAGLAGLEHGIGEILQGNIRPESGLFPSWGPPCVADQIWNACEPAMTILPTLLIAGILTVFLSIIVILWSGGFVQRKNGGWGLILLSVALLLAGGGFFPPIIGIAGGIAATQINRRLPEKSWKVTRLAAGLWPWPLVIFVVWLLGQFPIGYFFNDPLKSIMGWALLLILVSLLLSLYSGYAKDTALEGSRQ